MYILYVLHTSIDKHTQHLTELYHSYLVIFLFDILEYWTVLMESPKGERWWKLEMGSSYRHSRLGCSQFHLAGVQQFHTRQTLRHRSRIRPFSPLSLLHHSIMADLLFLSTPFCCLLLITFDALTNLEPIKLCFKYTQWLYLHSSLWQFRLKKFLIISALKGHPVRRPCPLVPRPPTIGNTPATSSLPRPFNIQEVSMWFCSHSSKLQRVQDQSQQMLLRH